MEEFNIDELLDLENQVTTEPEPLEIVTVDNTEELQLLNDLLVSSKTTNTLIMIIFVVALCILIYNLMWKFIRLFIN